MKSDIGRSAFAATWVKVVAMEMNRTWPALYKILRIIKEQEVYRKREFLSGDEPYDSFQEFFEKRVKQPFKTLAELEAEHHMLRDHAPDILELLSPSPVSGPVPEPEHPEYLEGIEEETDPDRIAGKLSMAFPL